MPPQLPATFRSAHLPCGWVVPEEGKHVCEPMIDLIECPLLLGRLQDSLEVRECGLSLEMVMDMGWGGNGQRERI